MPLLDTHFHVTYTTQLMATTESSSPRTRRLSPLLWWGLAALSLLLGYVDLARGGETLAAVLLVVGYCVLIPLAILK